MVVIIKLAFILVLLAAFVLLVRAIVNGVKTIDEAEEDLLDDKKSE